MRFPKDKSGFDTTVLEEEWTANERAAIIEETDRILADPVFKNSKRSLALFRDLVNRALAGNHENIKERTLGVEVFGRDVDYDTAVDPIVRLTATEIRKRLGQWYQEPEHHRRVRVRLVAGAYVLKFEFIQEPLLNIEVDRGAEEAPDPPLIEQPYTPPAQAGIQLEEVAFASAVRIRSRTWTIWATAIAILATVAVALLARHLDVFRTKDYVAWMPLLNSSQPVIICISDDSALVVPDHKANVDVIGHVIANREAPVDTSPSAYSHTAPMIDAEVSQTITGWWAMHGRKTVLRGSTALSLQDFHQGPIVLVGGYNPWSLILLSGLRFSLRTDPLTHQRWIQDTQKPSNRDWMIMVGAQQHADVDYAIITRLFDAETRSWILAIGGLQPHGTQAASELLTDSSLVQMLPAQLKSTGNFQIVLKTNIINGSPGPPQVLAVYTW